MVLASRFFHYAVNGDEDLTKLGKIRFIPMFKQARQALISQRMYPGLREFVFISRNGRSFYNSDVMIKAFKVLMKKNGFQSGTIHD